MMYLDYYRSSLMGRWRACGLTANEVWGLFSLLRNVERTRGIGDVVKQLRERQQALIWFSEQKGVQPFSTRPHTASGGKQWTSRWAPVTRLFNKSRWGRARAFRVLKVHGLFRASDPTVNDYLDLKEELGRSNSIEFPGYSKQTFKRLDRVFNTIPKSIGDFHREYPLSASSVPTFVGKSKPEFKVSPKEHLDNLDWCPRLVLEHYDFLQLASGKSLRPRSYYEVLAKDSRISLVGEIRILTKDRSLKMRPITNVSRLLGQGVSRLHNTLKAHLAAVPESFCFDQDAGAEWVSGKLKEGCRLSSLDLKSASDNIPLEPQLELVAHFYPELKSDLRLFKGIARSVFHGMENMEITYARGHGMGIPASFYLFTFWLLYAVLLNKLGRGRFAIVGDDLVFESSLRNQVKMLLTAYEVPFSPGKSIDDSISFAEFCGRILDKEGSLNAYKAAPINPFLDPLGAARQYGRVKGMLLVPFRYRSVIDLYLYATNGRVSQLEARIRSYEPKLSIDQASTLDSNFKPLKRVSLGIIPKAFVQRIVGNNAVALPQLNRTFHPIRYTSKGIEGGDVDKEGYNAHELEEIFASPSNKIDWINIWKLPANNRTFEQAITTFKYNVLADSLSGMNRQGYEESSSVAAAEVLLEKLNMNVPDYEFKTMSETDKNQKPIPGVSTIKPPLNFLRTFYKLWKTKTTFSWSDIFTKR